MASNARYGCRWSQRPRGWSQDPRGLAPAAPIPGASRKSTTRRLAAAARVRIATPPQLRNWGMGRRVTGSERTTAHPRRRSTHPPNDEALDVASGPQEALDCLGCHGPGEVVALRVGAVQLPQLVCLLAGFDPFRDSVQFEAGQQLEDRSDECPCRIG